MIALIGGTEIPLSPEQNQDPESMGAPWLRTLVQGLSDTMTVALGTVWGMNVPTDPPVRTIATRDVAGRGLATNTAQMPMLTAWVAGFGKSETQGSSVMLPMLVNVDWILNPTAITERFKTEAVWSAVTAAFANAMLLSWSPWRTPESWGESIPDACGLSSVSLEEARPLTIEADAGAQRIQLDAYRWVFRAKQTLTPKLTDGPVAPSRAEHKYHVGTLQDGVILYESLVTREAWT